MDNPWQRLLVLAETILLRTDDAFASLIETLQIYPTRHGNSTSLSRHFQAYPSHLRTPPYSDQHNIRTPSIAAEATLVSQCRSACGFLAGAVDSLRSSSFPVCRNKASISFSARTGSIPNSSRRSFNL
jgi:hypothetical protein